MSHGFTNQKESNNYKNQKNRKPNKSSNPSQENTNRHDLMKGYSGLLPQQLIKNYKGTRRHLWKKELDHIKKFQLPLIGRSTSKQQYYIGMIKRSLQYLYLQCQHYKNKILLYQYLNNQEDNIDFTYKLRKLIGKQIIVVVDGHLFIKENKIKRSQIQQFMKDPQIEIEQIKKFVEEHNKKQNSICPSLNSYFQ